MARPEVSGRKIGKPKPKAKGKAADVVDDDEEDKLVERPTAPRVETHRPENKNDDDDDDASDPNRRIKYFPDRSPFYSRAQVLELVPVTYACLWGWMRRGKFPLAREIGPSSSRRAKIGWLKSEVDHWLANRPQRIQKPRKVA